ncbi:cell division cycle protein 20 homolog B-like [Takifugu rubripes]|uniref:cell division cycle protein 20 homolog B-like n=1 Tax=Takifugu rubripes TaxID=31033 RepID=UPI001145FB5F|nr:cell division cycle protein 20 homolog B [Takifugu rubripes]
MQPGGGGVFTTVEVKMRQNHRAHPHLDNRRDFTGKRRQRLVENVSTPWGRQESYKRFKRRIIQRRNIDGHAASTPLTSRGRREAAFESDAVRQRLELDSPPGPREQGVSWINSPVIAGGESTSCLANISTSHNLNTRRHTEDNLNQKWLWRPEALEHANARGTGCDEKRSDLKPFTVVDQNKTFAAPMLLDDYYCNLLDCSSHNTVALALGSSVYIWNAETHTVVGSLEPDPLSGQESISSLCWSEDGRTLCVGTRRGEIQLWDADCKHMTRCLLAHVSVVRAVSWKWPLLSSGSALGSIFHHDFRAPASLIGSVFQEEGLCSLQWSPDGGRLASGSIEGLLSIWDSSITGCTGMRSPVTAMKQPSVVKRNTIATGGGYQDGKLRIWDALSGTCETIANTNSQICSLRWAEKRRCLVTGHGLPQHHIACWSWDFASLNLTSQFTGHSQRVLHLALNTGNTQILSAGADEHLRIWDM